MIKKVLIFTYIILLIWLPCSFAFSNKKMGFSWKQGYRYDTRQDNHQLYTNHFSLVFNYLSEKNKPLLKLIPFFEIRRNIDRELWERKELGMEIGKDILPWLYVGEAIQKGWMKENYRYCADYEKRDYTESETRLLFNHNLLSNKYIKLKGFVLNEYTYDFDKGQATRNELIAGFIIPLGKYIETDISWRHIDRIHTYDSDTIEASVTLVF